MSGFSAAWLQQREAFDAAARDRNLARRFGAALAGNSAAPKRLLDLAAGSGAGFRALAPLIGGDQSWLLVDHDPLLIAMQATEIARWALRHGWHCSDVDGAIVVETATARWRVQARPLDLAQSLEQIDFSGFDGITTTALLDLVSPAWLDLLGRLLQDAARPLLAALTVDGRRCWDPTLAADTPINDAFGRHQHRDKGFGPALGNLATAVLAEHLTARGYTVTTAHSDWHIKPADSDLLRQMVDEAAAVANVVEPAASKVIADWSAARHAQIESRHLRLDIGHLDLLALPTTQAPRRSAR